MPSDGDRISPERFLLPKCPFCIIFPQSSWSERLPEVAQDSIPAVTVNPVLYKRSKSLAERGQALMFSESLPFLRPRR